MAPNLQVEPGELPLIIDVRITENSFSGELVFCLENQEWHPMDLQQVDGGTMKQKQSLDHVAWDSWQELGFRDNVLWYI